MEKKNEAESSEHHLNNFSRLKKCLNLLIRLKRICMQNFSSSFTSSWITFEIKNQIKNFFCVISSSVFANFIFLRALKISWFSSSLIEEIYSKILKSSPVFDLNLLRESKEISNGHTKSSNWYVNDVKPLKMREEY